MRKILNIILLLTVNNLVFSQSPGTIGNSQTICYGSGPKDLVFTAPPTGGQPPYSYRWRQSINGSSFTDISGRGAAREIYSPPVLGRTSYFQCRVTDANNLVLGTTNTVQIIVRTPLTPGRITADPTAFAGVSPDPITQVEAAGGGGAEPAFQWQRSSDGIYWSDIQGSISTTYSPPPLLSDTWYRRLAINGNCGTTASNSVSISVNPISVYTSEVPSGYPTHDVWDLGTEFLALTDGVVSRIRLYTNESEGGVHTIRFWRATGFRQANELLAGPLSWDISVGTAGWREYPLPSPVQIISGQAYIVTITMEDINNISSEIDNYIPVATNNYIQYVRGRMATTPGNDHLEYSTTGYFRDVVFIPFSPGTVGNAQSVCYNTAPTALMQLTLPSGGAGSYNFQWQNSTDGITWSNIQGANSEGYSPPALTSTTYYRRGVISSALTVYSTPVLITVNPQFNSAHLQGTAQIFANTSTFFRAAITGGTPPYRIEYTRNGVSQTPIADYTSGSDIFTGILNGTYTYSITNVTDALNCSPQDISGNITITATGSYSGTATNKVLVLTNSSSSRYFIDFNFLIRPYLDWFGIPYDVININTDPLPAFNNYALIIFGHRNVYHIDYPTGQQNYPITALEEAISGGVGLYSFDPHLFDVPSSFNVLGAPHPEVTSSVMDLNTNHYITELHVNDTYNPSNNTFTLRDFGGQMYTTVPATSYNLTGTNVTSLVTLSDGINTEPLLQSAGFGNGRIVKWSAYDWMMHEKVGPIKGMDDIIWRGIVWAARKPFAMEGLPPMITMRVDDVDGSGINVANNFEWINICNEYGLIPWCGTFNNSIPLQYIPTLRNLINNGLATASPHAFSDQGFIYYNLNNLPVFSASENVIAARNFYNNNQLLMSNYMVPHFYLIDSEGLTEIRNMGIEFIGTKIPYDPSPYPGESLALGPYKKNWTEWGGPGKPYFFADSVHWLGNPFFISITEIGDDGGYEWYPNIGTTQEVIARGVRHLRRALNGMFLPTLFTHEYNLLVNIPATTWREMISGVTGAITSYNPEYRSMDYAVKYVRAKDNLRITNFTDNDNMVYVTVTGVNDMETRCYIFTESGGQISSEMVTLPRVTNSAAQVSVGFIK